MMTAIEYPKDKNGIKAIEVELFMLEEYKVLTQEDVVSPLLISKLEMPLKGDRILVKQLDGNCSIETAQKNLSNKDLYIESTRMVFKIICFIENTNSEYTNNITTKKWKHGDKFYLECENRIYNKKNQKEVDYIFYESNNIIFKIKEPINIL